MESTPRSPLIALASQPAVIIETVPIAEVLELECIVLNAARMARQVRREELEQLEAILQKPPLEPNHR